MASDRLFRAVATTVVPESARLGADEWDEVEGLVARALDRRPAAVRRQLGLLLRAVDVLARLRWGRGFAGLDPGRRERLLAALQDAPLVLLRRGVWGLRTLVFLGYYGRSGAAAEVGYRATARGWEARREARA